MSLSRGQLKSDAITQRFYRRAVEQEIRQGRPKSQILCVFQPQLRPIISALYDELAFTCEKCFMPFLRKSDLTRHARNHS